MADEVTDGKLKEPVDRSRRFKFIAWVTGFCLLSALAMTFVATTLLAPITTSGVVLTSPLIDLYVRGVLGLATATVISYVSGSVIDYNGGIGKLFSTQPKG